MTKFLSTLGLCRRAGKMIYGFDAVCDEIKKPDSKVCGVITASDLSEKSKKEMNFICGKYNVPLFTADADMKDIEGVLSRKTGIIAILDSGLYKSLTVN